MRWFLEPYQGILRTVCTLLLEICVVHLNQEGKASKRTCSRQLHLSVSRKYQPSETPEAFVHLPFLTSQALRKQGRTILSSSAMGLSGGSSYQPPAVAYPTGSFPRVSITGNFLWGSPCCINKEFLSPPKKQPGRVGRGGGRCQGTEGWIAVQEMEGTQNLLYFPLALDLSENCWWPGGALVYVGFHPQASSFYLRPSWTWREKPYSGYRFCWFSFTLNLSESVSSSANKTASWWLNEIDRSTSLIQRNW